MMDHVGSEEGTLLYQLLEDPNDANVAYMYELYVDGDLAIEGVFFEGFFSPCVGFGDITSSGSLAAWDYFRFGVVPEPATAPAFMIALVARRIVR